MILCTTKNQPQHMEAAAGAGGAIGGSGREAAAEEEDGGEQWLEEEAEAEAVYCAVGKEAVKEWKANLMWVLAAFPWRRRRSRIVLIHVHRPPSRVNMSMLHR